MFSKLHLPPNRRFPDDLSVLSFRDLDRLAGQLQEKIFRECNGRSGSVAQQTLLRQALVDLEITSLKGETALTTGFIR